MLPEHRKVISPDGHLKSHDIEANGGTDNIITISTSSIADCHSTPTDSDRPLKPAAAKPQAATRIVQFLSKRPIDTQSASDASTLSSSLSSSCSAAAQRRHPHCDCALCVSFQENIADVHHRRGRRLNGLQLPLHPLQLFGWLVLIVFGVASFWLLIPSFAPDIQGPLYGLIAGLYIVHVVSHLTALLIDPADRELRRVHRNDRIVPEFDRSRHTHVIENGRCHLCNIRTSSPRTKHCSVCNKCVGKFDHHCKWLNHCIGSRNYVAFLMCVVSAVIATLVIVAAVIAQIVLYYVQPDWLSFWQANATAFAPAAPANDIATGRETIAFVIGGGGGNVSLSDDAVNATEDSLQLIAVGGGGGGSSNESAFLAGSDIYLGNGTLPSLLDNLTTLVADGVNGSLHQNLSAASNDSLGGGKNGTTVTIAGISVSDTIFLILLGVLGLLAAITAGLLLHLCFFHIYISFLGLTTYEYIRNHRQAQEAKAKSLHTTLPNGQNGQQQQQHFASKTPPSKKTNTDCGQIYFCSSVRNPNAGNDPTDLRYFEARKAAARTAAAAADDEPTRAQLHCCANSREYHQTALKTYYMCSLLEEAAVSPATLGIAHISGGESSLYAGTHNRCDGVADTDPEHFKTFHCCSTFAASAMHRKVSTATTKATLVSDLEARRSYLQFTEQCTFCTFRIRSPIVAKRTGADGAHAADARSHAAAALKSELSQSSKASSAASHGGVGGGGAGVDHQRCCMKAISKHQRWRRKWNCCANVPDSPDVPNDIIATLTLAHQQHASATAAKKINATEIPVQFIRTANGSGNGNGAGAGRNSPTSPRSANLKAQARVRNARTWPAARLRHMMRMLNRYWRPRCRHHATAATGAGAVGVGVIANGDQVKQNQIRPLQLQQGGHGNGCRHQHGGCYDSSSPQPPSSTTTERSSDQSLYSDSSAITTPCAQPNTIETMILPTSAIRDETAMMYTMPVASMTLPPALPPPTRRKIPNPTDLDELAETLSFASSHQPHHHQHQHHPQHHQHHPSSGGAVTFTATGAQRLPALGNVYRRQRRKHFLRTRSPTLSPIHESGLSNPTSPQPCRHNTAGCSSSSTANITAAAVVNNLCGSAELVRKASSNSSLHSLSSNSSAST